MLAAFEEGGNPLALDDLAGPGPSPDWDPSPGRDPNPGRDPSPNLGRSGSSERPAEKKKSPKAAKDLVPLRDATGLEDLNAALDAAVADNAAAERKRRDPRAGKPLDLPDDYLPMAEERAELVVREIESVLRGHRGKTSKGMKMSDWKTATREIVLAELKEAEEARARHLLHTNRWVLMGSATVVSIGFWAAVYLIDKDYGTGASVILGIFGIVLLVLASEYFLRRIVRLHLRNRRTKLWGDIVTFDGRLKRLRKDIEMQLEALEDTSEEARKLRGKLWGGIRKREDG
ncbi:MAG: hypothetical protein ACPGOY_09935 [Rhodospirillaceae bacterium]